MSIGKGLVSVSDSIRLFPCLLFDEEPALFIMISFAHVVLWVWLATLLFSIEIKIECLPRDQLVDLRSD